MGVPMMERESRLSTIERALDALGNGGMVIVVDDENRENEGDFVLAARFATPEAVNFLAAQGRGLICVAMDAAWAGRLDLRVRPTDGRSALHDTAFADSVDYARGTTTGISASDRSATIRALADPASGADDFARPGHCFPLVAREGGVLARRGHTEATVDLCAAAGLEPVGALCEILRPDGSMARLPDLVALARDLDMPIVSVADLVAWRRSRERLITAERSVFLPTEHGNFRLTFFDGPFSRGPLALRPAAACANGPDGSQAGVSRPAKVPLVRVHSECLTGDVFGSRRCDCGPQLVAAMDMVAREGDGAVIYLRQEGRGIGLHAKIKAYALQDDGMDTWDANTALGFPPDARDYWEAAHIIRHFGWTGVRLLTNNPDKARSLAAYGITVTELVPLHVGACEHNKHYLETKRVRFGHLAER